MIKVHPFVIGLIFSGGFGFGFMSNYVIDRVVVPTLAGGMTPKAEGADKSPGAGSERAATPELGRFKAGWMRAAEWAKMPGLSEANRGVLLHLDREMGDPMIDVIRFGGTATNPAWPGTKFVGLDFRSKSGGVATKDEWLFEVRRDGSIKTYQVNYLPSSPEPWEFVEKAWVVPH
jgi:hypothetical protein